MLAHAIGRVADAHGEAIAEHLDVEATVPTKPFPHITTAEAPGVLRKGDWDPQGVKEDLNSEAERSISAHIREDQPPGVAASPTPALHRRRPRESPTAYTRLSRWCGAARKGVAHSRVLRVGCAARD